MIAISNGQVAIKRGLVIKDLAEINKGEDGAKTIDRAITTWITSGIETMITGVDVITAMRMDTVCMSAGITGLYNAGAVPTWDIKRKIVYIRY